MFAVYQNRGEAGGNGHYYLFAFAIEFKKRNFIRGEGFNRKYGEEVYIEELDPSQLVPVTVQ